MCTWKERFLEVLYYTLQVENRGGGGNQCSPTRNRLGLFHTKELSQEDYYYSIYDNHRWFAELSQMSLNYHRMMECQTPQFFPQKIHSVMFHDLIYYIPYPCNKKLQMLQLSCAISIASIFTPKNWFLSYLFHLKGTAATLTMVILDLNTLSSTRGYHIF